MDTMFLYFEIDEIRCRKHANPKSRDEDKEKTTSEIIHLKLNKLGEKNE